MSSFFIKYNPLFHGNQQLFCKFYLNNFLKTWKITIMSTNWFRYHDERKNRYFYYNTETQETVWKFPTENAKVWDAVTRKKVRPPADAKQPVSPKKSNKGTKNQTPEVFRELIDQLADLEYDSEQFTTMYLRKGKNKKADALVYNDIPISDSLVSTLKKPDAKLAVKNYKLILKLTGVNQKQKGEVYDLVKEVKENPALSDEVFVELWKQTTNAPPESLQQSLELFLVMATVFVPGPPFRKPLIKHMAQLAKDNLYARFVLIRLMSISAAGEVTLKNEDETSINVIPKDESISNYNFGVSLWEIFHHQQRSCPDMPIPLCMYKMLRKIQELDGFNTTGIFRLPGNMGRLDTLIYKANHEEEYLEGEDLMTIASLFKRWIRDIPGKLIPESAVPRLMEVTTTEEAIEFVQVLDYPSKMVLMYLIGFLRECAASKDKNQMGEKNLAMVFGPNVVYENGAVNPMELQARIQFCLQSLIEKWDVSFIYPLNEGLLPA
ncbi:Rho-GTPase-activating protein [Tritrichomonas foetus]|uniref:Rho-GTPase-activating protein n=1 Tax=Tritrichomonas foetus TaxID=1144522 RepID=A0A1J4JH60_9EUKA|nr:Rho-GTPase-activating protein [Tritrichomonas foetus]|eukprot:OHS96939.1 Rho-GTPase-activating protein [Tritrichomonas foetus]